MRRALQLAAASQFETHPNPMVGAVIVCDGKIIGEGCHRRCGEGHAEVNAIKSVKNRDLLKRSTIYVTLEPCSHYGKTPPCAKLIIDSGIPRVAIGASDPFEKVSGRGIGMLREAGVEAATGILADESRELNRHFFTAHTLRRPYVTLKWAMSSDRFMDIKRPPSVPAARFSTPLTTLLTHRIRSRHDAIITTARTVIADNPRLDARGWAGPSPQRVIIDRRGILQSGANIFITAQKPTLLYSSVQFKSTGIETVPIPADFPFNRLLEDLYNRGITSVLVEAGPRFLKSIIRSGLWDETRIETAPVILGTSGNHPAPAIPQGNSRSEHIGGNTITTIRNTTATSS